MEQLETGNIGIGNTSTLATLNNDRFIVVDQKEISWTGASLKDAGRLTFAAAKMGGGESHFRTSRFNPQGYVGTARIRQRQEGGVWIGSEAVTVLMDFIGL